MGEGSQLAELEGAPARILVHRGVEIEVYAGVFSAVVFSDDYLPASVRACVERERALHIDEEEQRILLVAPREMVVATFASQVHQWRARLNELGKQDLLPV